MSINQPLGILGIDRLSSHAGLELPAHSRAFDFTSRCEGGQHLGWRKEAVLPWGAAANSHCQTSGRLTLPETNGWNLPVEMNVVGI